MYVFNGREHHIRVFNIHYDYAGGIRGKERVTTSRFLLELASHAFSYRTDLMGPHRRAFVSEYSPTFSKIIRDQVGARATRTSTFGTGREVSRPAVQRA